MPHGGYHGTVKIGNNVVQTASQNPNTGQYEISGGIDNSSRLDFNPPQSNQNNQTAAQLEEQIKNQISGIDAPGSGVDGFEGEPIDSREAYIAAQADAQRLNNLMKKEQEEVLRTIMLGDAKAGQLQKENLLGYKGGLFGLNTGPNIGGTTYPDFAYQGFDGTGEYFNEINPITGERIRTVKAREGLSTPDYNKFISELYGANPELYQEKFPFASGQIAKPIFARIGEGIMGIPGASEIGQLASSVISPLSSLFTGQSTATPQTQYDNMGNAIGIINPKASTDGGEIPQAVPEGMDMSIYGSFIGKPGPFIANFVDQDGDGVDDRFQSGPGEAKAPPYSPPKQPINILPSTGLPAIANYASIAPQFTGSPYTNQGVSPAFLENLRRFYG